MAVKNIVGHSSQIQVLQQSLKKGTLAHAYLFYGPSGIGKETLAREFAKALNCEKGERDACDQCPNCHRIEAVTYPDHFVVKPTGAARIIKMEEILNLQKKLNLSRFEGRVKTIILTDADRLNEASSNALLKILEEPLEKTYFFLVSSNHDAILATIRSRCRQIPFYPLPLQEVDQILEKNGFKEKESRDHLTRLSDGSVGRALRWHEEKGGQLRQSLLKFALSGEQSATNALFVSEQMAKALEGDKSYLWDILEILEGIYRDLAAFKCGAKETLLLNPDWIQGLKKSTERYSLEDLDNHIQLIERIRGDLHRNIHTKFALDTMFLSLAGKQSTPIL